MTVATIVLRHLIPALQAIEKEINETELRETASKDAETKVLRSEPAPNRTKLMSVDEAADFLGLRKSTIYKYVMVRKIPFFKLGNRTLFKEQQLLAWLDGFAVETIGAVPRRRSRRI